MVGVALLRQGTVSVPDLSLGCLARDTEHLIVVDLICHRCLILTQGGACGPARQRQPYLLGAPRIFLRLGRHPERPLGTPDLTERPRRMSAHERRRILA